MFTEIFDQEIGCISGVNFGSDRSFRTPQTGDGQGGKASNVKMPWCPHHGVNGYRCLIGASPNTGPSLGSDILPDCYVAGMGGVEGVEMLIFRDENLCGSGFVLLDVDGISLISPGLKEQGPQALCCRPFLGSLEYN